MEDEKYLMLKALGKLPSPSEVGLRVIELAQDDDMSPEDLAAVILIDPALTSRVLSLANSAAISGIEAVTTVSEAVMRLGVQAASDLALAFTLVQNNRYGGCPGFDYDLYWEYALGRAVSTQLIHERFGGEHTEQAYICGLLCDLGKLALAELHHDTYAKVAGRSIHSRRALITREVREYEMNHIELTQLMLKDYGLPEEIVRAVGVLGGLQSPVSDLEHSIIDGDAIGAILTLPGRGLSLSRNRVKSQLFNLQQRLNFQESEMPMFFDGCTAAFSEWAEPFQVKAMPRSYSEVTQQLSRRPAA